MPPKPSKDGTPPKKSKERPAKQVSFPAQTLAEMTCKRARSIASFLKIKEYAKISWPSELAPLIKLAMSKNTACTPCGGGACDPETHKFPATNPYAEIDELGNPIVASDSEGDKSPAKSPDGRILDALAAAAQPHDRVVAQAENAPGFLDALASQNLDLPDGQAGGSGTASSAKDPTYQPVEDDSSPGEGDDDDESPLDSDSNEDDDHPEDDDLLQDEEFRKQVEALKLQNLTEKNTKINKKSQAAAARKKAREEAETKKAERRALQLKERQKQFLADMMAKHQADMLEDDAQSTDEDEDAVFVKATKSKHKKKSSIKAPAKPPAKGQHNSRSPIRPSAIPSRVKPKDTSRTHSARPASESDDDSGGFNMSTVLELMDRQHRNTLKVVKTALSANAPTRVPVSDLDDFGHGSTPAPCHEKSGRVQVVRVGNPTAARELGLNPPVNLALQGDLENIDISKVRKTLVSGKNRTAEGIVLEQHLWPHDCISKAGRHILGPKVKIKHDNQTFTHFNEGMVQKLLLDTPADKMDPILRNKLKFYSFILRQCYVLDWQHVLSIAEDFLEAFEYGNITWDSWPEMERFLKESAEQVRLSASFRGRANSAPPAADSYGSGAGAAGLRRNPGKKFADNANGVPSKWMMDKKICISFNLGYCQEASDHLVKTTTLKHWCGGCFKKSEGTDKLAHPASTCKNGPFGNLFA